MTLADMRRGVELTSTPACPRPFTSSSACTTAAFLWLPARSATTSPTLTENDGMSTLRPFTVKWPCRTSCRACGREVAKPSR